MYNFNLSDNEEVIKIFDKVLITQDNNERITSIVLTNQRLLFCDYINNDQAETLRVARGMDYIKYKEVTHIIYLKDIVSVDKDELYVVSLNNFSFEFNNEELYFMLNKVLEN